MLKGDDKEIERNLERREGKPLGGSAAEVAFVSLNSNPDYNKLAQEVWNKIGLEPDKVTWEYADKLQLLLNQAVWDRFVQVYPEKAEAFAKQNGLVDELGKIQNEMKMREEMGSKFKAREVELKEIMKQLKLLRDEINRKTKELKKGLLGKSGEYPAPAPAPEIESGQENLEFLQKLEAEMDEQINDIEETVSEAEGDLDPESVWEVESKVEEAKKKKTSAMKKLFNLFKSEKNERSPAEAETNFESGESSIGEKIKLSKSEYFNSLRSSWEAGLREAKDNLADQLEAREIPDDFLEKRFSKMLNLTGPAETAEEVIEMTQDAYEQNLQRMRTSAETAVREFLKEIKEKNNPSVEPSSAEPEPDIFTQEELAPEKVLEKEENSSVSNLEAKSVPDFFQEKTVEFSELSELEKKFAQAHSIREWQNILAEAKDEIETQGYYFADIIRTAYAIRDGSEVIDALPSDFGIRDAFKKICDDNEIKYATTAQVVESWRNRSLGESTAAAEQEADSGQQKGEGELEEEKDSVAVENEKVAEKAMENIDLSSAGIEKTLKEIVSNNPGALENLKILLENPAEVGDKSELITQTVEKLLREYFSALPLTPEQKRLVEGKIADFTERVEASVREKLQSTIDFQAMEKVGMWKSFMSRFSKKNLKEIGKTIGTVATIYIAGASIGLGAWTVGAAAGLAKAGLWLYKKYKDKRITEEEKQAEQEEMELKKEKLLQEGRAKVLETHDFDDSKGPDRNKFAMSAEELAHLLASTVKMESIKSFREGLLIDREGRIDESVRLALHDRIQDHVEHHPLYAGLNEQEKQKEIDKLYTIYARQMLNERELLALAQGKISPENKGKFMKVIEKVQSVLGGDIVDFKKKKDFDAKDMGLLFAGAAFIGGSMRVAYRHGAGGYLSALLGSLGGASFGYALARHKETARFVKTFQSEVKSLMGESRKDLEELKQVLLSSAPPAEKSKALTHYRNKLNRLEGMLNMSIPAEGGSQPLLRDEALRAEVQAFTFKAREFLADYSAEDTIDTSAAQAEGLTEAQVEVRKKMILNDALRNIEEDLHKEQSKIAIDLAEKLEKQGKKNLAIRTAAAVGGAVIGGLIGRYSYEGGRKLGQASRDFYHDIFASDDSQEGIRQAASGVAGVELGWNASGSKADTLQSVLFEKHSAGADSIDLAKFKGIFDQVKNPQAAATFKELVFSVEKGDSSAISENIAKLKGLGIDFKGHEQDFINSLKQRMVLIYEENQGKFLNEILSEQQKKVQASEIQQLKFKRGVVPQPSTDEEIEIRKSSIPPEPTPGHDIHSHEAKASLDKEASEQPHAIAPEAGKGTVGAAAVEHLNYQGGKHAWGEIEKQLSHRAGFKEVFSKWSSGSPERTYAIDYYKDKLVAHPEEYGLEVGKDFDIDHLTKKQLESIDWDKLFSENNPDKWAPQLTEAQKASIIKNNELLKEWVQKTGKTIESEDVNKLLRDINKAGSVEDYLAATAEKGGGIANWEEVQKAVESAKSFQEIFDKVNALDLDPANMPGEKINALLETKLKGLGFNENLKINEISYDANTGHINGFSGTLDKIGVKFDLGDNVTPDSFARIHESAKELRIFFTEHPQYKFDVSHMMVDAGDGSIDRVELDLPGSRQDVLLSFSRKGDNFVISSFEKLHPHGHIPTKIEYILRDLQNKAIEKPETRSLLEELGDEVGRLETRARVINVYEHRFNELKGNMSAEDFYKHRVKIVEEMQKYLDKHPEAGDYIKDKTLAAWLVDNKDVGKEKYNSLVKHLLDDSSEKSAAAETPQPEKVKEKIKTDVHRKITPERRKVIEEKIKDIEKQIEINDQKKDLGKSESAPAEEPETAADLTDEQKTELAKNLLHDLQKYAQGKGTTDKLLTNFKEETGLNWDKDKFNIMSKQLAEKLGSGASLRGNLKKLYDFIYDTNLDKLKK